MSTTAEDALWILAYLSHEKGPVQISHVGADHCKCGQCTEYVVTFTTGEFVNHEYVTQDFTLVRSEDFSDLINDLSKVTTDDIEKMVGAKFDELKAKSNNGMASAPACCVKHYNEYRAANPALIGRPFIACSICGNKRCPKASDCSLECTNSNEPGQSGSVYK